jgi:hypothetical protein
LKYSPARQISFQSFFHPSIGHGEKLDPARPGIVAGCLPDGSKSVNHILSFPPPLKLPTLIPVTTKLHTV